jgi:hemerythrin-like domain-containing protein
MKDRYEHHIEEEEEDIFPVAKDVLGADKSGEIASEFAERKKEERKLVDEKAEEALEE